MFGKRQSDSKLGLKAGLFLVTCALGLWGAQSLTDFVNTQLAEQRLAEVQARVVELGLPVDVEGLFAPPPLERNPDCALFQEAQGAFKATPGFAEIRDEINWFVWPEAGEVPDQETQDALDPLLPGFRVAIEMMRKAGEGEPCVEALGVVLGDGEGDEGQAVSDGVTVGSILAATTYERLEQGDVAGALQCVEAAFVHAKAWQRGLTYSSSWGSRALGLEAVDSARRVLPFVQDPASKLAAMPGWLSFLPTASSSLVLDFATNLHRARLELEGSLESQTIPGRTVTLDSGFQVSYTALLQLRIDHLEQHLAMLELLKLSAPEALAGAKELDRQREQRSPILDKLLGNGLERGLKVHLHANSTYLLLRLGSLALQFRQDSGDWPVSLEQFAPSYPLDPFTELPFLVEPTPTGLRLSCPEWATQRNEFLSWHLE